MIPRALQRLRDGLARSDALLPLSAIGVLSGLVTGIVIIAFRQISEASLPAVGVLTEAEGYESLSWPMRLALPTLGALILGVWFQLSNVGWRQVGVLHVMERLAYHAGRMPWKNVVLQFFGGALSIVSGHSVGREGPVIHVGAASSSLVGQWFGLPDNSLRSLVACGTAASIAASFNTPIAGVIFAMEVVMLEYSIVGFIPVMLAAVAATVVSRVVYGADPAFDVPPLPIASLLELPFVCLLGVVAGSMAALFTVSVSMLARVLQAYALWWRMTLAGLVTGLCALAAPEVMGVGYDTVELALLGGIGLAALIAITGLKLIATVACIGLGLPGGLIGPTLVMGATAGAALGIIGHEMAPLHSSGAGLYALLGMGAMMAATLQAPLAALMAILELTASPNSIMPGMLAVVTASLTSRLIFGQESVFIALLRLRGLDYRYDPVDLALNRTGVGAVMDRTLARVSHPIESATITRLMREPPEWVLEIRSETVAGIFDGASLGAALLAADPRGDADTVDLSELTERREFVTVPLQATLNDALAMLDARGVDVALVVGAGRPDPESVYGVLTRAAIESSVRYRT
jgi:H+/Cl- antiporter ClcA